MTLTLPRIHALLEQLLPSQSLTLAESRVGQLFGSNDIVTDTLRAFAKGRGCTVVRTEFGVTFQKPPHLVAKRSLPFIRNVTDAR
jgi:hypothetical protein